MAVGIKALTENTTTILDSDYRDLIKQSEQLRILKNIIKKSKNTYISVDTLTIVVDAMDDKEALENE